MIKNLLKDIIFKSFPTIGDASIFIELADVFDKEDAYCIYYSIDDYFLINIDRSLCKNKNALIGAIVHELCHIEWQLTNGESYYKEDFVLYQKNLKHRYRDEVFTDLQTIFLGYGKELLELMKCYENNPTKEYSAGLYCGLNVSDIKQLTNRS